MSCLRNAVSFVCLAAVLLSGIDASRAAAAELLRVTDDFEGGSAQVLELDQAGRSVSFMPGGDPRRGWPCWWCMRVAGLTPGETLTLRLRGSTATVGNAKPLAASWAMPDRATFSIDGETWLHTEPGKRQDGGIVYTLQPQAESVVVAWGPPYTPATAEKFVRDMAQKSPHATARLLCRSREDRPVPMLSIREGELPASERFGVWVQARQHAWESGSSWVAQGFGEWLLSDAAEAAWLRRHAEIYLVPVMDIDNTATGNGGKNAVPHDHNRDWSPQPHWNEIIAAQKQVNALIDEGRMDIFLDLHNPAPGDPTFFFVAPDEQLKEPAIRLRNQFTDLACDRIAQIRPSTPVSNKQRSTGPSYHPLWRQISANWVAMRGNPQTVSVCLETSWNNPTSTTAGYRAIGASLAGAVQTFLQERPATP
ncbi:M14-type cytosolic carboxypeptidase [Lignipirellula cremea]|uniref:Zinc carboxypeptidase n=1 Tax=Lignipirellula cremea TaxID=2528010 RepID=A0A518DMN7_9BACT|nr:M14-type cytosolic carboxypeptidase [Lignipirellula cremea]QDU93099.1 Zinc carboxypeptidase [Lignipirellula cremea]